MNFRFIRNYCGLTPPPIRTAIVAIVLLCVGTVASRAAQTFTVTSLADSGTGTLRAAITTANSSPGSTIIFQSGLMGTISLASSLPTIAADMTVSGPGAKSIAIDGANQLRIITDGDSGGSVTISGLTVQRAGQIGVYQQYSGDLTLTACNFVGNKDAGNGGGAVFNNGTVIINSCLFSGNSVSGSFPNGGALENNFGNAQVNNCTFTGNTCTVNGGAIYNLGTLAVSGSTFTENEALTSGGNAGAIYCGSGSFTAVNCTFSGNSAGAYGGAINGVKNSLINCTFWMNTAVNGGGAIASNGTTAVQNCILWSDSPSENYVVSGQSETASYCDIDGGLTGITDEGGNIDASPLFSSAGLTNNGGPTETIALQDGSPCLGAGTASGAPLLDQRGVTRPNPPSIGSYDASSVPTAHRFDFNSDGLDDLLFQNSSGQTLVWNMNGEAVKSYGSVFTTVAPPWHTQAVADINADGHPDLLWWNSSTGECLFWEMTGSLGTTVLQYESSFASIPDTHWHPVSMADFNGDGHPDILWENFSTGQLLIWYMNGNTITKYGSAFTTLPANWIIAGTADFNQDGHPDLLLENTKTGQVLVWYLTGANGTTILTYGSTFATVSDTNWSIVSTGDMNGDGHPDLTWHNKSTGATDVWLMGGSLGTTVESYGGNIGSVPTTWSIVGVN